MRVINILLASSYFFSLSAFAKPATDARLGESVSNAIIQRYTPTIDVMTHHGWDHSNSAILHGIEKIYNKTHNKAYLDYIKAYVDTFVHADGSISGLELTLDGIQPGVLCLFLFEQTGEQKYKIAAKVMRDHLLGTDIKPSPFGKTPEGGIWHKTDEKYKNVMSVDGLYMAYPFLVHYAKVFNDKQAFDVAAQQILMVSEHSFNIKTNLPYHAWSYDHQRPWANPTTGTASQFWSRSVGWYAMALVDVLEYFPKDHPAYNTILLTFQSLAQGVKAAQNPKDGLWCQVADACGKPGNYSEVSGSGMIVYALQKGINLQLIDPSFHSVALSGWKGLQKNVTQFEDGGPQINSVAPPMSSQVDYAAYVAIRPVSVPAKSGSHHAHGYIATLMASSVMETF